MPPALTGPRLRLLRVLAEWDDGVLPPTYRELADAVGWRSVGTVRGHVAALAEAGLVRTPAGRARGLVLTPAGRRAARAAAEEAVASAPLETPEAEGLGPELEALLAPWLEHRHLPAGRLLWSQGEPARMAVFLETGRVRTFRTQPSGRRVAYYDFHAGDAFGLLPLVDGAPYPADAEVVEDAQVAFVSRPSFLRALDAEPRLARLLLFSLAKRQREALERLRDLSEHDAPARVARVLLAEASSTRKTPQPVVSLHDTACATAESVGMSAPTFSRALHDFIEQGTIEQVGPRRYRILDREALRRRAGPTGW